MLLSYIGSQSLVYSISAAALSSHYSKVKLRPDLLQHTRGLLA